VARSCPASTPRPVRGYRASRRAHLAPFGGSLVPCVDSPARARLSGEQESLPRHLRWLARILRIRWSSHRFQPAGAPVNHQTLARYHPSLNPWTGQGLRRFRRAHLRLPSHGVCRLGQTR
jgi:hypothetical protein